MFRVTPCVLSVRTIFYRRYPVDFQIASISRFPAAFKYKNPRERETCRLPPPPPKRAKDDRLFWGGLALLFLAGSWVVYAKGSPEIRDWLTINAPWIDDLIAILYQENMTYEEFACSCIEDMKRYIAKLSGSNQPKKCSLKGGPVPNYDVPEEPKANAVEEDDNSPICELLPPPVVTQNICDIETCMKDFGESALNNYNTAKDACVYYNLLVEETMQKFSYKRMKALRQAKKERLSLVKESLNNASHSINKLDEIVRYLDCGVKATKEQIENSKLLHRELHDQFKAAFMAYQLEADKSIAKDRQWKMVEQVIDKYTEENEFMYPGLKYDSQKPSLTGDADILLYNSYRYIQLLNEELNDASEAMSERVNRAFDGLPHCEKKKKARGELLQAILKIKRQELVKEFKEREANLRADNDRKLKRLLRNQVEKHEVTLSEKLAEREADLRGKFDGMVADKVTAEKKIFIAQLEEMALNLQVVEDKLKLRVKAERETRRSQELWSAGALLLEATKKGDPYVKVDKELRAIEKASGGEDKLVKTVLRSIPSSVRERGVVPESVLRQSFHSMEKMARNVALVEQDGAPMAVYILSWFQGLLLFMRVSGIPQTEFDKPPEEPPKDLDTFDLLQRARFWVERGNLAAALRYVSSLKGASRAAAAKWFEDARAHLEVRQAAEAVLAHAAAMGLRYI